MYGKLTGHYTVHPEQDFGVSIAHKGLLSEAIYYNSYCSIHIKLGQWETSRSLGGPQSLKETLLNHVHKLNAEGKEITWTVMESLIDTTGGYYITCPVIMVIIMLGMAKQRALVESTVHCKKFKFLTTVLNNTGNMLQYYGIHSIM